MCLQPNRETRISGFFEQGFLDYTDKELPAESPPQFGLHPNAEIGYLTNSCESLFKAILNIAGQDYDTLSIESTQRMKLPITPVQ